MWTGSTAIHGLFALVGFAGLLVALAAPAKAGDGTRGAADAKLRADLEGLASRTVFFAHQSVGFDILRGIEQLAVAQGVSLRVVEASSGLPSGPLLAHARVGQNLDPTGKLEDFERMLAGPLGDRAQVALVKLCYVDFHAGTDVGALFRQYRSFAERVRIARPGVTLVHVTAPLTTAPGGLKGLARRLLRRDGPEAQNARREEYNALLRAAYGGREPLFDLARVESTAPDGQRRTVSWKGREVPVLVPGYTTDGGHLNEEGSRRAGRELASVLAAIPARSDARADGVP